MNLSTLELHQIRQALFEKVLVTPKSSLYFRELMRTYKKVSKELVNRQNPIKSSLRGPIHCIKWPVEELGNLYT